MLVRLALGSNEVLRLSHEKDDASIYMQSAPGDSWRFHRKSLHQRAALDGNSRVCVSFLYSRWRMLPRKAGIDSLA